MWTWWFSGASLLSAAGIAIGAFGAHALKGRLTPEDAAIFETASRYLSTQSIGLLCISLCMSRMENTALKISAMAMFFGILIFSGTLFALVGTGIRWLGAITPIGGTLMIIGWLMAAFAVAKANLK